MADDHPLPTNPRFQDLRGRTFSKLKVAGYAGRSSNASHGAVWRCVCECGRETRVYGGDLKSGNTKSCGCGQPSHGKSRTTEHAIWNQMKQRCNNPRVRTYACYGGRGISVCARWNDFVSFLEDMGPRPSKKHSLDRIDNDGPYCCGKCEECLAAGRAPNCRWATKLTQANNARTNHRLTWRGETHTLAEWERITGIQQSTIRVRIRAGWPAERALSAPVKRLRRREATAQQ